MHRRFSPLVHRYRQAEVEAAFARFQRLTGETDARLDRVKEQDGTSYTITNSPTLGAFTAYSAKAAYDTLTRYCEGYVDGAVAIVDATRDGTDPDLVIAIAQKTIADRAPWSTDACPCGAKLDAYGNCERRLECPDLS
jgi:hypothetical protein